MHLQLQFVNRAKKNWDENTKIPFNNKVLRNTKFTQHMFVAY